MQPFLSNVGREVLSGRPAVAFHDELGAEVLTHFFHVSDGFNTFTDVIDIALCDGSDAVSTAELFADGLREYLRCEDWYIDARDENDR